jgi:hypothetical protein
MSVGNDIKKAFRKVGVSFAIVRDAGNISGEYLVYDTSVMSSRVFVKEFVIDSLLVYDTQVVPGDVLHLSNNLHYLVAHKIGEMLSNNTVVLEACLYKCNFVSGEVVRSSGEVIDSQYHTVPQWVCVKNGIKGLITESLIGNASSLDTGNEFGDLSLKKKTLLLPSALDVRVNDRFIPSSGEYYKVETIEPWTYPGLNVLLVSEDTR